MPTLAELKTRVIAETNRDDMGAGGELEAVLDTAIARAIEHHADEGFWFNRASAPADTVPAAATAALPAEVRVALSVALGETLLAKAALEEIAHLAAAGTPRQWAADDGAIRLHPIPDAAYQLTVSGIAELGVPAGANAWTEQGYDLISARTRLLLYRDVLRDPEGAGLAAQAEEEALTRLRRETRRRARHPARTGLPTAAGFDIATG
jgi:hypothetical protein